MNNEKKNCSNQKNPKRRSEKAKNSKTDGSSGSHNDSSSSSENFQKELVEVFEKCIELRGNASESNNQVIGKLYNAKVDQNYESSKCNSIDSSIFHKEYQNPMTCSEVNGLAPINSKNKGVESIKNNEEFLESINNNKQEKNNGLPKEDSPNNEAASLNINAQLSYTNGLDINNIKIEYKEYESEVQMQDIMKLIQAELSEPYSIYTYRYFIYNWPKLCFLATHGNKYVGAIVCKLDMHMNVVKRGYIAMLAVKKEYRKLKIGTNLVQKAIDAMLADNADEVVLETEMKNVSALRLYENLGFVRDKRLFRYYLNGVDALRLKLWFN